MNIEIKEGEVVKVSFLGMEIFLKDVSVKDIEQLEDSVRYLEEHAITNKDTEKLVKERKKRTVYTPSKKEIDSVMVSKADEKVEKITKELHREDKKRKDITDNPLHKWSKEEDKYLEENYDHGKGAEKVAKKFNRTVQAVRCRAHIKGLTRGYSKHTKYTKKKKKEFSMREERKKGWKEEEDEYIIQNANSNIEDIAEHLNRPVELVKIRFYDLKTMGRIPD